MGSNLESLMEERIYRQKLGPTFRYADLEPILNKAHDLRHRDNIPFDEALDIAAEKTRLSYGSPRNE